MGNQIVKQVLISNQDSLDQSRDVEILALFNADGTPFDPGHDGTDGVDNVIGLITVTGLIGTAAKTTTSPEPPAGTIVPIKFTSGNTAASVTVAFNGGAARVVHLGGTANAGVELTVGANGIALFYFDGTYLNQVGVVS